MPSDIVSSSPSVVLEYSRGPLLAQCAESKVYLCDFYGLPAICKHRFEKQYRHPKLDHKLRDQRTVREARALARCALLGIRVPAVYAVHRPTSEIIMERIAGETVKDLLDTLCTPLQTSSPMQPNSSPTLKRLRSSSPASLPPLLPPLVLQLLEGIGEVVGLLHNHGIIHGDLTTSNFLYESTTSKSALDGSSAARDGLVIIDFGLITEKITAEDRAVDLYVLFRALNATHPTLESVGEQSILKGYQRTVPPKQATNTLQRLKMVKARGRKRSMVG